MPPSLEIGGEDLQNQFLHAQELIYGQNFMEAVKFDLIALPPGTI